jgi:hypothetical protein
MTQCPTTLTARTFQAILIKLILYDGKKILIIFKDANDFHN